MDPSVAPNEKEGEVEPAFLKPLKEVTVGARNAAQGWKALSARIVPAIFIVACYVFLSSCCQVREVRLDGKSLVSEGDKSERGGRTPSMEIRYQHTSSLVID